MPPHPDLEPEVGEALPLPDAASGDPSLDSDSEDHVADWLQRQPVSCECARTQGNSKVTLQFELQTSNNCKVTAITNYCTYNDYIVASLRLQYSDSETCDNLNGRLRRV